MKYSTKLEQRKYAMISNIFIVVIYVIEVKLELRNYATISNLHVSNRKFSGV